MSAFLWLICSVFVILVASVVSRILWLNTYVKHLPRIPFSTCLSFLTQVKSPKEFFQSLEEISHLNNGMTTVWFGPKMAVICDDPEDMRRIFMSKDCFDKSYVYHMLRLAGNGIFSASGHDWRPDRKSINAVFSLSVLKSFEPILNRRSYEFAQSLEKYVDQPESDFTQHVFRSTFNAVLETNFHYDYESQNGNSSEYIDNIARAWEISSMRASSLLLHPEIFYRFSSLYAEEKKVNDYLGTLAPKMILHSLERRRTELSNGMATDDGASKSMNLIDKLLALEEKGLMDRQRITDQIYTFIAAALDTSSLTVLNTLLLLAMNQDVQDRVYEELRSNIENEDYVDYDTFTKLEYLDRVMKESMRLLTLGFFVLRETAADLELTQCTVPKGTILILNSLKLHRGEKTWGSTALEFDPDRFLPEAVAQRHPFAFLPFGAGPRNCIGYKYAMVSMKVMMCHLLLRYKFTTSMRMSDLAFKFEFLLKLDNKYMLKLEKRPAH